MYKAVYTGTALSPGTLLPSSPDPLVPRHIVLELVRKAHVCRNPAPIEAPNAEEPVKGYTSTEWMYPVKS